MKACRSCNEVKVLDDYAIRTPSADGRAGICKACQRLLSRRHYLENRQAYIDRAARRRRASRKQERAALREFIRGLKSVPCADCGGRFAPHVMHFDHVRGEKRFNLSQGYRLTRRLILEEVAKCDVVCGNCHARRTYNRRVAVRP